MTGRLDSLRVVLAAGIVLRVIVFFSASPFNPDNHWQVIQYIVEHHRLPTSELLGQSYHPPLYYALMAPLAAAGGVRLVHLASLLISCATLWLIYRLTRRAELFHSRPIALLCLSFAAFLPELVMFGHFISNDTLTIWNILKNAFSLTLTNAGGQGTVIWV